VAALAEGPLLVATSVATTVGPFLRFCGGVLVSWKTWARRVLGSGVLTHWRLCGAYDSWRWFWLRRFLARDPVDLCAESAQLGRCWERTGVGSWHPVGGQRCRWANAQARGPVRWAGGRLMAALGGPLS